MGILTKFTPGAAIPDIFINANPESMGQIQKVVFQRIFSSGATKNKFVQATNAPTALASWTAFLDASDGTKAVQTPYISAPTMEPGAARTYGGGNETLDGIELTIGREPTTFNANILQASSRAIESIKDFQVENVGVYFIDEFGSIAMLADDVETPTEYYPVPVRSVFVGDRKFGGLEEPDMNVFSFILLPNWSDKLVQIQPADFNALTDLVATP